MSVMYSDGTFRNLDKGILEYRFLYEQKRYSVYGKTKKICYEKRQSKCLNILKKASALSVVKNDLLYKDWLQIWLDTYKKPYYGSASIRSNTIYVNILSKNILGLKKHKRYKSFRHTKFY